MSQYSEISGWESAKFDWDVDYSNNPVGAGCVIPSIVGMCLHYAFSERTVALYAWNGHISIYPVIPGVFISPEDISGPFCSNTTFYVNVFASGHLVKHTFDSASPTSSCVREFISNTSAPSYPSWVRINTTGGKYREYAGWSGTPWSPFKHTIITSPVGVIAHNRIIENNVTKPTDLYLTADEIYEITGDQKAGVPSSLYAQYPSCTTSRKDDTIVSWLTAQPILQWIVSLYKYYNYAYLFTRMASCAGTRHNLRYKGPTPPTTLADYEVLDSYDSVVIGPEIGISPYCYVRDADPLSEDYPGYYLGRGFYTDINTVFTDRIKAFVGPTVPMRYIKQIKWGVKNILLHGLNNWPGTGPKEGTLFELGSAYTGATDSGEAVPTVNFSCTDYFSGCSTLDKSILYQTQLLAICDFSVVGGFTMLNRS